MVRLTAGHRVEPVAAPGLAAGDAFDTEPAALEHSMVHDGLEKILGTGGLITAARAGAADEVKHWGQEALVTANQQADGRFHVLGGLDFGRNDYDPDKGRTSYSIGSRNCKRPRTRLRAFNVAYTTDCCKLCATTADPVRVFSERSL